jgi:outer membrane lipoprotein carrier protein
VRSRLAIVGGAVVSLAAVVALMGAATAKATPAAPKVVDVVRKLQARYDATKDFTADFTQTVEAVTLGKPLQSTGQVFFKRPGRMRWEFLEPEKQTIVADGKLLWVYQPEHHQVLKTPFRAAFQSATPISFLLGVGQLKNDFDATLLSSGPDVVRLKLVPKREHEIGVLVLDVGSQTYDIVAAEVTDPLGNVTRLAFSNLQRDVGLDDSPFTFIVPPGTDVVEPPQTS